MYNVISSMPRQCCVIAVMVGYCALPVGCSSSDGASGAQTSLVEQRSTAPAKDRRLLRQIERQPPPCTDSEACPYGSHCDAALAICRWECIADTDCGPQASCTSNGTCVSASRSSLATPITPYSDNDSSACQHVPSDERLRVLGTLNDDQVSCPNGDDSCPCGAYCNGLTGLCEVDCIAGVTDPPASIPGCASNQQCTSFGRCEDSASTPPPPVQALTLQVSPLVISGNTMTGPAVVTAAVSVRANSLDFVQPEHPAVVRYQLQHAPGQPPPPAGSTPLFKCAPDASFSGHCDLTAWTFHVDSGSLVSDTQTLWVQLPQSTTATQWLLEARSDWALAPATATISVQPVAFPATDPGRYTGTMSWANSGATGPAAVLSVPVDAIVTSDHVALYERSRILLPDGHAVFSRDASKVTSLAWLSAGSARYDVLFSLGLTGYDSTTGHLDGTGRVRTSAQQTQVSLSLQRTGDVGVASCPTSGSCAAGTYCETTMNQCLPGSAPAPGGGIVSSTGATPTTTLASSLMADWNPFLTTMLSRTPLLAGSTPREQFERPYCYQNSFQGAPATFAHGASLVAPSNDLACNAAGGEVPQLTFGLLNHQQEIGQNADGSSFNLLNSCTADLDTPPSSTAPGTNDCVSVARFLLALRPDQPDDFGYRMKTQLLRQWLSTTAYVANTTVRDQQYEDALGVDGQSPAAHFASAIDRVEKGLGIVLDPSARPYYAPDNGIASEVGPAPDYRFLRPIARYSFNEPMFTAWTNVENGKPIDQCFRSWNNPPNYWVAQDSADFPCHSANVGRLVSTGGFSIVLEYLKLQPSNSLIFGDTIAELSNSDGTTKLDVRGQVQSANGNDFEIAINLFAQQNSSSTFIPFPPTSEPAQGDNADYGLLAIIKRGSLYTVMRAMPGRPSETLHVNGPDLPNLASARDLAFGGAGNGLDELSFWDRALSPEEFTDMAARYFVAPRTFNNDTLPASPSSPLGGEQAVGLPVHMLEAVNGDLNLVQAYVDAARATIYSQCLAGTHAELDAVLARVGNNLRMVEIVGDEAVAMVNAAGSSMPWFARFQADFMELGGRRAGLISSVVALQGSECKNPIGITEQDLPLYVGSAGASAAERFFAGSRFLANAALSEITIAGGETGSDGLLAQARQAYNAARSSQFQETQGVHDRADRILKISTDYEDQLKRYCGAPDGEDVAHGRFSLLAGFQSGLYTTKNCFLKTELSECAELGNVPLTSIPAHCLRGEMGERVLAIQGAVIDADNANNAHDRAEDQYNADMAYCAELRVQLDGDEALLKAHQADMLEILLEKEAMHGDRLSKLKAFASATLESGFMGIPEQMGFNLGGFEQRQIDEQNKFEVAKQASNDKATVEACKQKAFAEHFAMDAATDTIVRAYQQVQSAGTAFDEDVNFVNALAAEGAGQLAIETTIDRTPPHLHYWLDQTISSYHAHMAYARRLTYLAVRAFEYESQQSSGLRDDVLNAQLPNDLKTVAGTILNAIAPFAGRSIDDGPLVLSLRDDVLQIADLSKNSSRRDGSAPLTPIEAFKELLKSDATKVYDRSGNYVGHGIRFSLRPQAVDAQTCAERISRIKPSVTLDNASQEITHTRLILAAANTFGSQQCGDTVPGPLVLARVQPSQALLVGDALPTFQDPSPFSTTGLFPLINTARDTLRNMTFPADDTSAFAGRGRYGDYILIFPDDPQQCTPTLCDGWSTDALERVSDVLLRFDIVEQDNTHL